MLFIIYISLYYYCQGSRPALYYWWDETEVPGCTCEENHCVIMNRNKKGEYRWKTTRCNSSHHHLCMGDENMECVHEKPSLPSVKLDTTIQTTENINIQTTMCPEQMAPATMLAENETESTLSGRNGSLSVLFRCSFIHVCAKLKKKQILLCY